MSGYLLARAIMETYALFWYFLDKVSSALKDGDVKGFREILTRMLIGVKLEVDRDAVAEAAQTSKAELGKNLKPIHVMDLLRHVENEIPPFIGVYEFLCEVSHPNSTRLIRAYVRNDWGKKVAYFGKEEGCFGNHLPSDLEALIASLEGFMDLYDRSADLLLELQSLCESKLS